MDRERLNKKILLKLAQSVQWMILYLTA